jgi:hypothetical protein
MGEKEEEGGPEVDVADVPLRLRGRQRLTHVPSWRVHMAVSSRCGATAGFGWLLVHWWVQWTFMDGDGGWRSGGSIPIFRNCSSSFS